MSASDLNFKHAADSTISFSFVVEWLLCTALNAATVFVLVAAALVAWGRFA